ncbi:MULTISPECIES: HTH-type transcriptional regulator UlaR [Basfia]|nr:MULTISPECIES: HTH-type transcriptional regulator UlaR [Basfia]SEQ17388.1 transcriptional regulator, DeoR family [Basfia succiniciproducens]
MNEQIRHNKLLTLLGENGFLSVQEIMTALNISPATARRDITKLNEQGRLKKLRNGAEAVIQSTFQPQKKQNEIKNLDEKQRIAALAASLCQNDSSAILTCGSTMLLLGNALCNRNVQIITNYLPLANQLIENDHERVVIMGGQYNKSQAITLSLSEHNEAFAADIMFTSGKGLTAQGLYKTDMVIASSEQRLLKRAQKLIVLVDSSKLDKTVGMLFTELKNIDLIITGQEADPDFIRTLREKGVDVMLA